MAAPSSKLIKPQGEKSSDIEQHVSTVSLIFLLFIEWAEVKSFFFKALLELELNADIKTQLRELYFVGAKVCCVLLFIVANGST